MFWVILLGSSITFNLYKMKTFYAVVALLATLGAADVLPECANSCIEEGMKYVPCQMNEIKCLCKKENFAILEADGMPCLKKECGEKKAQGMAILNHA